MVSSIYPIKKRISRPGPAMFVGHSLWLINTITKPIILQTTNSLTIGAFFEFFSGWEFIPSLLVAQHNRIALTIPDDNHFGIWR
jgi:hypothetical protein